MTHPLLFTIAVATLPVLLLWYATDYLPEQDRRDVMLRDLEAYAQTQFDEWVTGVYAGVGEIIYTYYVPSTNDDLEGLIRGARDFVNKARDTLHPAPPIDAPQTRYCLHWASQPEFHVADHDGVRATYLHMRFFCTRIAEDPYA